MILKSPTSPVIRVCVPNDSDNAACRSLRLVSEKCRTSIIQEFLENRTHETFVAFPALPSQFPLLLEFGVKPIHVELHGFLIRNFLRKVQRESE